MSNIDRLRSTRSDRIKRFLDQIGSKLDQFKDFVIDWNIYRAPLKSKINAGYYNRYRLGLPISYETNVKYRLKLQDVIYEWYKFGSNLYLIHCENLPIDTKSFLTKFKNTIYFSYCFYFVYHQLKDLVDKGYKLELNDMVFKELTSEFNCETGDTDITVYVTEFSYPDKDYNNKNLYISIFN